MQSESRPNRFHQAMVWAGVTTLFVLYGLYAATVVEPRLLWRDAPSVFLLDTRFFADFASRPGGLAEYAAAFVSTLLADRALGAGALAGLAALICLTTHRLLVLCRGYGGVFLPLAPGAFLLALMGQYSHPVGFSVGVLFVLLAALGYAHLSRLAWPWRIGVLVCSSALVLHAAGGFYGFYALLCAAVEWRARRRPTWAVSWVLCALTDFAVAGAAPWGSRFLHAIEAPALIPLEGPKLAIHRAMRLALLAFFPAALLTARRRTAPARIGRAGALALASAAALVLWTASAWLSFDPETRVRRRLAHAVDRGDWAAVRALSVRRPLAEYWATGAPNVHRALYAQGRLLDDLFAYPQSATRETLLQAQHRYDAAMHRSDLFFDLGWINGSLHMAYEALVVRGKHPRVLERLIRLHAVKGQHQAAAVFARYLRASLLHGPWASRCVAELERDPTLSSDPQVASRRELMVKTDYTGPESIESITIRLLASNPRNRMAFEYLMAHYLLTRQPGKIASELDRFRLLAYETIPRLCQEAVVIHHLTREPGTAARAPDGIDPRTIERGREFARLVGGRRQGRIFVEAGAYARYRDSYFFYHRFGRTSGTKGFVLSGDAL